jgi:hypothetical protein
MPETITVSLDPHNYVTDAGDFVISYTKLYDSVTLYDIATVNYAQLNSGYIYTIAEGETNGIGVRSIGSYSGCTSYVRAVKTFPVFQIENAFNDNSTTFSIINVGSGGQIPDDIISGQNFTRYYHLDDSYEYTTQNMFVDINTTSGCDIILTDSNGTVETKYAGIGWSRTPFSTKWVEGALRPVIIRIQTHI